MGTGAQLPIGGAGGTPEKYRSLEAGVFFTPNIFVDDINGLDSNDGALMTPFKTLNRARTAALISVVPNHIYVFRGTYNEEIIMSTVLFLGEPNIDWYLETGVFINVTQSILSDSLTHFFDVILLDIRGHGFISCSGQNILDTTECFFSEMNIECVNFVVSPTAINSTPVILDAANDDNLHVNLISLGDNENSVGQFGYGSSVNVDNDDYFIRSQGTHGKAGDNFDIRGGEFATRQAGAIFQRSDVNYFNCDFFTIGVQNTTNEVNGIHSDGGILTLNANEQGAELGSLNVRALGTTGYLGGFHEIKIADNGHDSRHPFTSEIQIMSGYCHIDRCSWSSDPAEIARYIWCDTTGEIRINDSILEGNSDQLVSAYNAATKLYLNNTRIKTTVGDAVYLFTDLVDIINCQLVAMSVCVNGPDLPTKAVNFYNTVGDKALPVGILDNNLWYTVLPFDEIQ